MSKRELKAWGVLGFALVLVLFALSVIGACQLAHAQASQPASQSVVAVSCWAWVMANSTWLVPLALELLAALATGLTNYPKTKGVISTIRLVLAALSPVVFKGSAGTLKVPGTPHAAPEA